MKSTTVVVFIGLCAAQMLSVSSNFRGINPNDADREDGDFCESRANIDLELSRLRGWKYLDQDKCGFVFSKKIQAACKKNNKKKDGKEGKNAVSVSKRIIAGIAAQEGEFPWFARLIYKGDRATCAGVLITKKHVLTAHHCDAGDLTCVKLGTGNNTQTVGICKKYFIDKYEKYGGSTSYNSDPYDIAVLLLKNEVKLNEHVVPVCLPLGKLASETFTGLLGTIGGYGYTADKGELSNILITAKLPIISQEECKKYRNTSKELICTSGKRKSACGGDSGGPLVVRDKCTRQHTLVGVYVSVTGGRCTEGKPASFVRVTEYLKFIVEAIGKNG